MAKNHTDLVEVFHKGDKKLGIEGTGKKRTMGSVQFENWGKNNGWALVPKTTETDAPKEELKEEIKEANSETANDSENTSTETKTETTTPVILSKDDAAKDAIIKINKLGKAKDLDAIKVYIDGEARVSVLSAANKFLNA